MKIVSGLSSGGESNPGSPGGVAANDPQISPRIAATLPHPLGFLLRLLGDHLLSSLLLKLQRLDSLVRRLIQLPNLFDRLDQMMLRSNRVVRRRITVSWVLGSTHLPFTGDLLGTLLILFLLAWNVRRSILVPLEEFVQLLISQVKSDRPTSFGWTEVGVSVTFSFIEALGVLGMTATSGRPHAPLFIFTSATVVVLNVPTSPFPHLCKGIRERQISSPSFPEVKHFDRPLLGFVTATGNEGIPSDRHFYLLLLVVDLLPQLPAADPSYSCLQFYPSAVLLTTAVQFAKPSLSCLLLCSLAATGLVLPTCNWSSRASCSCLAASAPAALQAAVCPCSFLVAAQTAFPCRLIVCYHCPLVCRAILPASANWYLLLPACRLQLFVAALGSSLCAFSPNSEACYLALPASTTKGSVLVYNAVELQSLCQCEYFWDQRNFPTTRTGCFFVRGDKRAMRGEGRKLSEIFNGQALRTIGLLLPRCCLATVKPIDFRGCLLERRSERHEKSGWRMGRRQCPSSRIEGTMTKNGENEI
ncbi:Autophagy-related protein 18b [Platanthera guangdongensis]|uniref:Autophagy-related protein 18b n=1 Tax=Platanthera guangdongensis TaxID=2320717 RepID=A0ABR2MWU2_9ASPA